MALDANKVLNNVEQSIVTLEGNLEALPENQRHEVGYMPHNIENSLRIINTTKAGRECADRIDTLHQRFRDLVQRFALSPTYYQLKGNIDPFEGERFSGYGEE